MLILVQICFDDIIFGSNNLIAKSLRAWSHGYIIMVWTSNVFIDKDERGVDIDVTRW